MIADRIGALRKQAAELEEQAVAAQRKESRLGALQREREAYVLRAAQAHSHPPDERELLPDVYGFAGAAIRAAKTWGERAAELDARIRSVDTEIERVGGR